MSKPDAYISSPFKGGRGRMADLYAEVREINWQRECAAKRDYLERREAWMQEIIDLHGASTRA